MSRRRLKARDKLIKKMSSDGLIEHNVTTGEDLRISGREAELNLSEKNLHNQSGQNSSKQTYSHRGNRSVAVNGKQGDVSADVYKGRKNRAIQRHRTDSKDKSYIDEQHSKSGADVQAGVRHSKGNPMGSGGTNDEVNYGGPSGEKSYQGNSESTGRVMDDAHGEGRRSKFKPDDTKESLYRHDKPSTISHDKQTAIQHDKHAGNSDGTNDNDLSKRRGKSKSSSAEFAAKPHGTTEQSKTESAMAESFVDTGSAETDGTKQPANHTSTKLQADKPGKLMFVDDDSDQSSTGHGQSDRSRYSHNRQDNGGDSPNSSGTTQPSSGDRTPRDSASSEHPNDSSLPSAAIDDGMDVQSDKYTRKLAKAERKMDTASGKLDKARNKLPAKHKLKTERVFDENSGKAKSKLTFEKEVISQAEHMKGPVPLRPIKYGVNTAIAKAHMKVFQVENDNVGVKAGHKVELAAEGAVRSALRYRKTRPYTRVAKAERNLTKKTVKHGQRKVLAGNPKLRSNMFSRMMQKRRIRRQQIMAARRARLTAKFTIKAAVAAKALVSKVAVKTVAVLANPKVLLVLLVAALIIFLIAALVSACGSLASGAGHTIATSYLADEDSIDNAALAYTEWEMELQLRIANIQNEFSGFDEYRFQVGMIDHNPLELMAYLTAAHLDFTYPEIRGVLQELFDAQYQLSFSESVEIRYYEDAYGNPVPYEWRVHTTILTTRSLTAVIHERLSDDQRQHFNLLMMTSGSRHIVGSPFEANWHPFVTSNYGWRIHPISGNPELHRGIDIGFPTGTPILAAHDGIVTFADEMGGYGNVIFLVGDNGIETRYAHCDTLLVTEGQEVSMGDIIATVGSTGNSTGPHLHFEILRDGIYRNPIFFARTNAGIGGPTFGNPGIPMGDGSFEALLTLGQTLLGRPYVWGASGPNSFDCSGLIYFLLNQSGAANVIRTTAQGYFNMSSPVAPVDARPGDLIFFAGTFSSANTVTHVGVYLGGGQMLHTGGNPNGVEIVSINTPFWQNHLHGFGRLP